MVFIAQAIDPITILNPIWARSKRRPDCEFQVKGFNRPIFKKFSTRAEAEKHCRDNGGQLSGESASIGPTPAPAAKRPLSVSSAGAGPAKRTKLIELPGAAAVDIAQMKKHGDQYFLEDVDGYVHVYTDGSCEGNGTSRAIAGLGVYFSEGHAL